MNEMKRNVNFSLDMNSIATVASLLLLTVPLLYVSGAPADWEMDMSLHTLKSLLDDGSGTLLREDNNISRQLNLSLMRSEEITTTSNSSVPIITDHNFSSRLNTPLGIEAKDMEESFVDPKDDDDSVRLNEPQSTTTIVPSVSSINITNSSVKTGDYEKHATEPVNIFPDNPDRSISDLPLDIQRKFTHDTYFVGVDGTNATKVPDVSIVPVKSSTMESFNIPTVQNSYLTLETREEIMKKHLDMISLENKNQEKLPAGVIGLISAVGFATIVVAAFIGLIGWKRYQEYLHGHRELLVNDFDSNDVNNFEL